MESINNKFLLASTAALTLIVGTVFLLSKTQEISEPYVQPEFYEGLTAYEHSEFTKAESLWKNVLAQSRTFDAGTAASLGALLKEQSRFAEAEPLLKRVLAEDKILFGPDSFETACAMRSLADVYEGQGKLKSASMLQNSARKIFSRVKGEEGLDTALSIDAVARLHVKQGQSLVARQLLQDTLRCFEKKLGKSHRNTQFIRHSLTCMLIVQ